MSDLGTTPSKMPSPTRLHITKQSENGIAVAQKVVDEEGDLLLCRAWGKGHLWRSPQYNLHAFLEIWHIYINMQYIIPYRYINKQKYINIYKYIKTTRRQKEEIFMHKRKPPPSLSEKQTISGNVKHNEFIAAPQKPRAQKVWATFKPWNNWTKSNPVVFWMWLTCFPVRYQTRTVSKTYLRTTLKPHS